MAFFSMDRAEPFPNLLSLSTSNGNLFVNVLAVTPVAMPTPTLPAEAVEAQSFNVTTAQIAGAPERLSSRLRRLETLCCALTKPLPHF
jgi:hypothetical protein